MAIFRKQQIKSLLKKLYVNFLKIYLFIPVERGKKFFILSAQVLLYESRKRKKKCIKFFPRESHFQNPGVALVAGYTIGSTGRLITSWWMTEREARPDWYAIRIYIYIRIQRAKWKDKCLPGITVRFSINSEGYIGNDHRRVFESIQRSYRRTSVALILSTTREELFNGVKI